MNCLFLLSDAEFCCVIKVVFFFKHKTAYEMRISDWISDVCSSDLNAFVSIARSQGIETQRFQKIAKHCKLRGVVVDRQDGLPGPGISGHHFGGRGVRRRRGRLRKHQPDRESRPATGLRSEEHTSELQSLMRTSYAVFCLKKKKTINKIVKDTCIVNINHNVDQYYIQGI